MKLEQVLESDRLWVISEREFLALCEEEHLSEGVQDLLAKARRFSAGLPEDIAKAASYVAKQAGGVLNGENKVFVKAKQLIAGLPVTIPSSMRTRLVLGLTLALLSASGIQAGEGDLSQQVAQTKQALSQVVQDIYGNKNAGIALKNLLKQAQEAGTATDAEESARLLQVVKGGIRSLSLRLGQGSEQILKDAVTKAYKGSS